MGKRSFIYILTAFVATISLGTLSSCNKKVGKTSVIVMDSVRHYYSVLQGQELKLTYRIANLGDNPLVFTDIQPSCGCISDDGDDNNVVLPHAEGKLQFTFRTNKYVGYVHHTIRCFGNVEPNGMLELIFDTNVVPPYMGSPDYEDIYKREQDEKFRLEQFMDEGANERGYWTDDGGFSKSHARYPWKEEKEKTEY